MAEFVTLHHDHDNSEVIVNRDNIVYIESYNGGSDIHLVGDKTLVVKEPPKLVRTKTT